MPCPVCDQKAANCDCTEKEIEQHERIQDLEEQLAELDDLAGAIVKRLGGSDLRLEDKRPGVHAGYVLQRLENSVLCERKNTSRQAEFAARLIKVKVPSLDRPEHRDWHFCEGWRYCESMFIKAMEAAFVAYVK